MAFQILLEDYSSEVCIAIVFSYLTPLPPPGPEQNPGYILGNQVRVVRPTITIYRHDCRTR